MFKHKYNYIKKNVWARLYVPETDVSKNKHNLTRLSTSVKVQILKTPLPEKHREQQVCLLYWTQSYTGFNSRLIVLSLFATTVHLTTSKTLEFSRRRAQNTLGFLIKVYGEWRKPMSPEIVILSYPYNMEKDKQKRSQLYF